MKTIIFFALALLQIAPLFADDAQATPVSVNSVVKQRIALLTQIVEYTKKQYDMGEVTEEQLLNARLELYAFSRDSSKSKAGQIRWQERIVATEREKKASLDHLAASGTVGAVDALRAAERVLAAEQKLLELKAAK